MNASTIVLLIIIPFGIAAGFLLIYWRMFFVYLFKHLKTVHPEYYERIGSPRISVAPTSRAIRGGGYAYKWLDQLPADFPQDDASCQGVPASLRRLRKSLLALSILLGIAAIGAVAAVVIVASSSPVSAETYTGLSTSPNKTN